MKGKFLQEKEAKQRCLIMSPAAVCTEVKHLFKYKIYPEKG